MRISVVSLALAGTGCSGSDDGVETPGSAEAADDDTGTAPVREPETSCDDQRDDDGDGKIDCADDDCAAEELCSWPVSLDFGAQLAFEASPLAQLAGYDDCRVRLTASLERDREEACEGCDRVFSGVFSFVSDDCPEDFERPEDGSYGVSFQSGTSWEIFGRIDGAWISLGVAVDGGAGTMQLEDRAPIEVNGLEVGELISRFGFTPR